MKSVKLFGASWCPYCLSTKAWLEKHQVEFEYFDVDDSNLKSKMQEIVPNNETIPVVAIDGKGYVNPTKKLLADELALSMDDKEESHDLVVIGAGPAALSAAIYTTREDIDTVLIEKGVVGGLAAITDKIDNYPGFAEGISGMDLADSLWKQAERFGTKIEFGEVTAVETEGDKKRVVTTTKDYIADAVLIATGSDWKKLGVPGEKEYYGKGVHYCATCDGPLYKDRKLVVVGGGNSAVQEAIFLTKFASHIDLLVRGDSLKASEILQKDITKYQDKITIRYNTTTDEILGADNRVNKVIGTDKKNSKKVEFDADGVFIFIGLEPTTTFLSTSGVELDEVGFVKANSKLETNISGIFAAGDVRSGATMQIASATGEGATAALMIREYLHELHK